MKKFAEKVVVITGGAGEIGVTTAKRFLEGGAKVVIVDLDENKLKESSDRLGSENLAYFAADVTKADEVKNYVDFTVEKFGKIDVFFNNAGIEGVVQPTDQYPEDVFDQVIAVNVKGVWLGSLVGVIFFQ